MTGLVFATNNGDIGGGEVMLLQMARAARELGADVTVVGPTRPSGLVAAARDAGFHTIALPADGRTAWMRALRRWDARRGDAVLWCNGLVPALATAGHARRVVHLHQFPSPPQRLALRVARRGALRVVVPSRALAGAVRDALVLPNWTDDVVPVATADTPDGRLRVGFIGRHSTAKGLVTLAAAIAQLDRRHPGSYRLVVAGGSRFVPPRDAEEVEARLDELGPLVTRLGWTTREKFFGAIDLLAVPSVGEESFGLVVAEAQAARVPFVITDVPALVEVAGGDYPWVAERGSRSSLRDAIQRAAAAPDPALTDRSRRRWERLFSPAAGRAALRSLLAGLDVLKGAP